MLTETNNAVPCSLASVDIDQATKAAQAVVGSSKEAARTALLRPSFTPIYVEHKKKVPFTTFELNTAALNPLARRGLERLPRVNGVPVIRAMGKEEGLGFSFLFRIDPTEMTAAALPSLLERWYEKYETAKAKAGLTPKPEKPPEPLVPRSPRRKMEILPGQELDGEAHGVEVIKVDMSVVDSAIKSYEAKAVTAVLASSQAQHVELPDPLSEGPLVHGEAMNDAQKSANPSLTKNESPEVQHDRHHDNDSRSTSEESHPLLNSAKNFSESEFKTAVSATNQTSQDKFRKTGAAVARTKSKYEPLPYHYVVGSPDEDDTDQDDQVENVRVEHAQSSIAINKSVAAQGQAKGQDLGKAPTHAHAQDSSSDWPLDEDFPISFGDEHAHDFGYVPFDALDTVAPKIAHHPKAHEHEGSNANEHHLPTTTAAEQSGTAATSDESSAEPAPLAPLPMQLPAVRLQGYDQDITSQQWTDEKAATVWTAWTTLTFSVQTPDVSEDKASPKIAATAHNLPLESFEAQMHETLGDDLMPVVTMGSNIQVATQQWLPMAVSQLIESVEDTLKAARTPMARRQQFLEQAVNELPQRLDSLQAMLVDLQLAKDLARRVRKNLLGMPEWATVVLATIELNDHWHQSYLDAANFREAAAVLARWSRPLAELNLINQLGLFGEPQTLQLLRQLVHIVEHARKWSQPAGTRGDCARVLAVWVDVVHHFTPECAQEESC